MAQPSLSPYEQARADRIERNRARLASLGLLDAKKRVRSAAAGGRKRARPSPSTPAPAPRRRILRSESRASITPSPARTSRRLKRKPVQYEPLMDDDAAVRVARKRFKEVKKATRRAISSSFRCDVPESSSSSPLTAAQRALIKKRMEGDFLGKFEDYVTGVDALSDQNRRNVLRQIGKLAAGEGIRYESKAYGWPEGCYFLEGTRVGPADDLPRLMDVGRECEEEWGRDHGNGWLLSHPLKKLYQFQQYHLQG